MATTGSGRQAEHSGFLLEGTWVPTRVNEWYSYAPFSKHRWNGRTCCTSMKLDANGRGGGYVGWCYRSLQVMEIYPGNYLAKATARGLTCLPCMVAGDTELQLLLDGTVKLTMVSRGLIEYWVLASGSPIAKNGKELYAQKLEIEEQLRASECKKPLRVLKLAFRNFAHRDMGVKTTDNAYWHWGLAVGEEELTYEVNANETTMSMAVKGPDGTVASNERLLVADRKKTNLRTDWDGYLILDTTTRKTRRELETFTEAWVAYHPRYNAIGPNCQTYAEDLYVYLTGKHLPYAKSTTRMLGKAPGDGPEKNPFAVWLNPAAKPGVQRQASSASRSNSRNLSGSCLSNIAPYVLDILRSCLPRGKGFLKVQPLSPEILEEQNVSIPLSDGASVRANVYRPREGGPKFPVLVHASPHGKDDTPKLGCLCNRWNLQYNLMKVGLGGDIGKITLSDRTPWEAIDPNAWCARGYAVVQVDTRGFFASATGNAGGGGLITPRECQDYQEIVKWLATKAVWSTGKVGSIGVSYLAISQWNMAGGRQKHDEHSGWGPKVPPISTDHLACMVAWEGMASLERTAFCGGCTPNNFCKMWMASTPTTGGAHGELFNGQGDLTTAVSDMEATNGLYDSVSPVAITTTEPERIRVPVLTCQSWSDQGVHNPDGFEAWQRLTTRSRYLYTHGRKKWDVFYNEAVPVIERFLEFYLKDGMKSPWEGDKPVRIEVRETAEKCTVRYESTFPLPSRRTTMLYMNLVDQSLCLLPPSAEPSSTLGLPLSKGAAPLIFEHRFAEETELTGYMCLKLSIELQGADDAEVYIRIDKLAPDGSVVYFDGVMGDTQAPVATGELRLSHYVSLGDADEGPKRRGPLQPWYTHRKRKPLSAGEIIEVQIPVRPSSTLFRKYEKLRLLITGSGDTGFKMTSREIAQSGTLLLHGSREAGLLVPVIPLGLESLSPTRRASATT